MVLACVGGGRQPPSSWLRRAGCTPSGKGSRVYHLASPASSSSLAGPCLAAAGSVAAQASSPDSGRQRRSLRPRRAADSTGVHPTAAQPQQRATGRAINTVVAAAAADPLDQQEQQQDGSRQLVINAMPDPALWLDEDLPAAAAAADQGSSTRQQQQPQQQHGPEQRLDDKTGHLGTGHYLGVYELAAGGPAAAAAADGADPGAAAALQDQPARSSSSRSRRSAGSSKQHAKERPEAAASAPSSELPGPDGPQDDSSSSSSSSSRPPGWLKPPAAAGGGSRPKGRRSRRSGQLNTHKAAQLMREFDVIMREQDAEQREWLHEQEMRFLQLLASGASPRQLKQEEQRHSRLMSARLQKWGPPVDRTSLPQPRQSQRVSGGGGRQRSRQQGQDSSGAKGQQQQQRGQQGVPAAAAAGAFDIPDDLPEVVAAAAAATAAAGKVQGVLNKQAGTTAIVEALSRDPFDTQVLDGLEIVFLHLALPRIISYNLTHLVPKLASYLLARPDMNEHTCGALFNAYASLDRPDLALSTWEDLAAAGVDIGPYGASALIKAIARQKDVSTALQVFDQLLRRRVTFNAYTYNCLLQLCCSAGHMEDALAVYNLQRLETEPASLPDAFTYTALMRGVLLSGRVELTQQLFENMQEDGVLPDARLYCIFLTCAGRSGNLGLARHLYQHMASTLDLPPAKTWEQQQQQQRQEEGQQREEGQQQEKEEEQSGQQPAAAAGSEPSSGSSRQQQEAAAEPANGSTANILLLVNALLFAHAQVGALQGALAVYRQELLGRGLAPDAYTCTALLTACARLTSCQLSWADVAGVMDMMQRYDVQLTTQLGTALINALRRVRVWQRTQGQQGRNRQVAGTAAGSLQDELEQQQTGRRAGRRHQQQDKLFSSGGSSSSDDEDAAAAAAEEQQQRQGEWEQQQLAAAGAVQLRGVEPVVCAALAAAGRVLQSLRSRKLASSNTFVMMMCFLMEQGQVGACKQLYSDMLAAGIKPDSAGWERLLSAGQDSGLAEFMQALKQRQEQAAAQQMLQQRLQQRQAQAQR